MTLTSSIRCHESTLTEWRLLLLLQLIVRCSSWRMIREDPQIIVVKRTPLSNLECLGPVLAWNPKVHGCKANRTEYGCQHICHTTLLKSIRQHVCQWIAIVKDGSASGQRDKSKALEMRNRVMRKGQWPLAHQQLSFAPGRTGDNDALYFACGPSPQKKQKVRDVMRSEKIKEFEAPPPRASAAPSKTWTYDERSFGWNNFHANWSPFRSFTGKTDECDVEFWAKSIRIVYGCVSWEIIASGARSRFQTRVISVF